MTSNCTDEQREALTSLGFVSRETVYKLELFVAELGRWHKAKNLVSASTLQDVWNRHVLDSAQLWLLAPDRGRWLDIGSGGGLPGVVLAIILAEQGGHIHLVEANARKCAFLRHVIRICGGSGTVHNARIEDTMDGFVGKVDVVTARAVAPLARLLTWTNEVLRNGAIALFPKGQDVVAELTEAATFWNIDHDLVPSRTDPLARIVRITSVREAG